MPRILHVSQVAKAGVGTYLDLIWTVRDPGHEHHAVLPQSQPDGVASEMPRVTFDDTGRGVGCIWRMIRAVRAEVRRRDPDIVFLHSSFAMAVLPLLSFGRAKVVFCAHGWPSDRYGRGWKQRVVALAERVLPRFAVQVVNISGYEQRLAEARGLGARSVMIENAALPVVAEPVEGPPQQGLTLLFAGRFARQKGLDLLLQAIAAVGRSDLVLKIVGGTRAEAEAAAGGRLPPGVQVLDWMSKAEVAGQMAAADALIVPSRWEGFGLVIAESFAQGTPALVSAVGAMPDLVTDRKTGAVFAADVAGIEACLAGLDRDRLRAMRPACLEVYAARFQPERFGLEINALFEELATVDQGR
ncbi:glycosyltransferase family 4 protein [Yoonia sp. R2331]|uniref:glycosyltransferase family 4 protein n=1 Tax=Yoonia sp. R2331 TaxID=3237238 RepID=UPI0034E4A510